MMRRKVSENLPLPANFYPISCAAFIEDKSTRVTILVEHSHGFSSLESGNHIQSLLKYLSKLNAHQTQNF